MTKVSRERIDGLMGAMKFSTCKMGSKTTVVTGTLPSGFEITESSSCVDPGNYDEAVGAKICRDRIRHRLWELEGYLLQSRTNKTDKE